jgi:hypothetical protein
MNNRFLLNFKFYEDGFSCLGYRYRLSNFSSNSSRLLSACLSATAWLYALNPVAGKACETKEGQIDFAYKLDGNIGYILSVPHGRHGSGALAVGWHPCNLEWDLNQTYSYPVLQNPDAHFVSLSSRTYTYVQSLFVKTLESWHLCREAAQPSNPEIENCLQAILDQNFEYFNKTYPEFFERTLAREVNHAAPYLLAATGLFAIGFLGYRTYQAYHNRYQADHAEETAETTRAKKSN